MITAVFRRGGLWRGVEVSGHAGWAAAGRDVVCASVSSAVQLTSNGITEILKVPAKVLVDENTVCCELPAGAKKEASDFIDALYLHFNLLAQDYPDYIKITVLEV